MLIITKIVILKYIFQILLLYFGFQIMQTNIRLKAAKSLEVHEVEVQPQIKIIKNFRIELSKLSLKAVCYLNNGTRSLGILRVKVKKPGFSSMFLIKNKQLKIIFKKYSRKLFCILFCHTIIFEYNKFMISLFFLLFYLT